MPWEDWEPGDDRNTSAWLRATSPSGRADLEGVPLWSGELGYGVRPPQAGQSDPQAADVPADFDVSVREVGAAELKGVGRGHGQAGQAAGRRQSRSGPSRGAAECELLAASQAASEPPGRDPGQRLGVGRLRRRRHHGPAGAAGVVLQRNPVHCALALVTTIFGIALLFIDQGADFLAAVQVIVYAGAIVILFLFVIMLLGVDRKEARTQDRS